MSTDAQLKGDSLRRQLENSQRYISEHDLELVDDLRDLGVSAFRGANVEHGALGKFIQAVRNGHIESGSFLIVEAFDRISRQPPRIAMQLILELINNGIKVVTLANKQIYSSESYDALQLITSIIEMSTAAEESSKKSQRVKAAWQAGRNKINTRKLTSRGPAWLSYNSITQQFEPIPDRVEIIRRIFDEAIKGIGAYTIAKRLNDDRVPTFGSSKRWQPSSVSFIITSPRVIGEFQLHREEAGIRISEGEPIKGYFPSVVPYDVYYAAQAARLGRKATGGGRKGKFFSNIFAKLVYCRYCGSRMLYEDKGAGPKGGTYFVCMSIPTGSDCIRTRWRYDDFEASFLAFVQQVDLGSIFAAEQDTARRTSLETEIASLKGQLLLLRQKRDRTFELQISGDVDVLFIAGKLREFDEQIQKEEAKIRAAQVALSAMSDVASRFYESRDQIKSLIDSVRAKNGDSYKTRAQIATRLQSLIERIEVASEGQAPSNRRIDKFFRTIATDEGSDPSQREDALETLNLHRKAISDKENLRFFSVKFKDGTIQIVWPAADDPLKFERKVAPVYVFGDEEIQVVSPRS